MEKFIKKKCAGCEKLFIPNKYTPNHQRFCSRRCNVKNSKWARDWYRSVQDEYYKMKENIGCQICGFNESGIALDWHHVNGRDKQKRLFSTTWKNNPEKFQKEIEECILLCKNHHFMLHESTWRSED